MALVCDIKSDNQQQQEVVEEAVVNENDDLEDGEIEDDDEEVAVPAATADAEQPEPAAEQQPQAKFSPRVSRFDRPDRHRYEDRKRNHLTEAEKSVLHLHKIERLEREKRDRFKRDQTTTVDDFASNIEKAIANVLRKDKKHSDDEKEDEDKRGKKRKKKDKDRKKTKQFKPDADENAQGACSPVQKSRSGTPKSDYDSYDSSTSSSSRKDKKKELDKNSRSKTASKDNVRGDKKFKERSREQKAEQPLKDAQGVCLFYLQGKCTKENDCPYSHEASQPLKLELCKFYLMGCCAKGEHCHYMHSEFPCKFYHTGLPCYQGDSCKFAHGKPLEENLRQILFKHIETAPKEILGEFPRLSREGALTMIQQAQKALEVKYGVEKTTCTDSTNEKSAIPSLFELNIPVPAELLLKDDSKSKDKDKPSRERNRPSRWQDPEPIENAQETATTNQVHLTFGLKGFYSERGDQDMRVNSNGDIDMRTLPPRLFPTQDTDIRPQVDFSKDVDIRQITQFEMPTPNDDHLVDEPKLEIVTDEENQDRIETKATTVPAHLPKKQRELFLRIKAQQKETVPEVAKDDSDLDANNIDWYSDDDDDDDENRLTIRDDTEEIAKPKEDVEVALPLQIKPVDVIEKLGDLSKIDISAEVTKMLLNSINQTKAMSPKDPRATQPCEPKPAAAVIADPRRARVNSTETKKPDKMSIYDQGSLTMDADFGDKDMDMRPKFVDTDLRTSGRPDIDLRQLGLPFKAMQNYTPASEIDASINSHVPIIWRVHLVDIPKPDYTGLKLSPHEAQNTGDPRLRKIFRLNSTDEKDSPASPKESPKATTPTVRIDPRRRKLEDKPPPMLAEPNLMTYSQQLNVLQTSAFYQSLTSNQKVLLNQELASKYDNSGNNDQTLNGILSNLGLLTGQNSIIPTANTSALNILANINNMNQIPFVNPNTNVVNQMAQSIVQPGLLGAAPGVPNLPPDFQLNFDPRQGGLLGNAPNFNYNENQNFNNYNDEYYEEGGNNFIETNNVVRGGRGGGHRGGGFRDRQRRGRNFNGRNHSRGNFRNRSRNNRSRTPP